MDRMENLQEELLKTKKSHAFAVREISILRTKIKILEKEVKKKDLQIDELLKNEPLPTKNEQRLQLNSLKRKLVQFERALRQKTEEVAKLLSDRNIARAAENRQQLEQLNIECARLRKHLYQSVPESEFLREKHQYMDIIGQLTDENIVMRKMIGELKHNCQANQIELELDEQAFTAEMRKLELEKKKDVKHYKDALNLLINQRNLKKNSLNNWDQKPIRRQVTRSKSVNTNPENNSRTVKASLNKYPIRSQPVMSKATIFRSNSIEQSSPVNQKRPLSRQASDVNLISVSRPDSDTETYGRQILMPTKRGTRNYAMYRNIGSDSSSPKDSFVGHAQLDNIMQYNNSTDETNDSKDDSKLPIELYDIEGNVYHVRPELDKQKETQARFDLNAFNSSDSTEDLRNRSADTWLEIASLLSGQVDAEERVIVRMLQLHVVRLRMFRIRQESL